MSVTETNQDPARSLRSARLPLWRLFLLGRSAVTGVFLLVLFGLNQWRVTPVMTPLFMVSGLQFAVNGVYYYLWRQRDVIFMGYLCFTLEVALITLLILFFGPGGHAFVLAYLWPIILSGLLLGPRALLASTLLSTIAYAILYALMRPGLFFLSDVQTTDFTLQAVVLSLPYLAFIALLGWLLTRQIHGDDQALRTQNQALQQANERLRTLYAASEDLLACLMLDDLADTALDHCARITGRDAAALYVRRDGHLSLVKQSHKSDDWPSPAQTAVAVKKLETLDGKGLDLIVGGDDTQDGATSEGQHSVTTSSRPTVTQITLRSPRGLEGVLSVLSPGDRAASSGETHALQILGHQLGAALENVRLFQDLARERNRLQSILLQMTEAVVLANEDEVLLCNAAAQHMLGAREGAPLPQWLVEALSEQESEDGSGGVTVVERGPRALAVSVAELTTGDDGPSAMLCVARDITERMRAERLRNDFVAYVSHELRTPLTTIKMMLPLVEMDIPRESQSQEYLGIIKDQVERQRRLVSNLLDVARLEAGRYALAPEVINISDVIAASRGVCRPLAEEKGVRLQTDGMPQISMVSNSGGLEQVLINLLSNAIKFSEPGDTVTVSCVANEEEVAISVRDTGVGMSPEEQECIFQKYYTVRNHRKRGEGTGLGLVITRMILQELDGSVDVESELGVGSCFTVRLPRSNALLEKQAV